MMFEGFERSDKKRVPIGKLAIGLGIAVAILFTFARYLIFAGNHW
jgi:hypothetical protein